jgi:hypothetical protein
LRSGPRSYLAFVILQRIYLAVNIDYYPINELDSRYKNLNATVTEDWTANVSGGWRFLF